MRGILCAWALLVQLLAAPAHCGVTGYMGEPTTDQSPEKPTAYANARRPAGDRRHLRLRAGFEPLRPDSGHPRLIPSYHAV